jgi:hypothetical protein
MALIQIEKSVQSIAKNLNKSSCSVSGITNLLAEDHRTAMAATARRQGTNARYVPDFE